MNAGPLVLDGQRTRRELGGWMRLIRREKCPRKPLCEIAQQVRDMIRDREGSPPEVGRKEDFGGQGHAADHAIRQIFNGEAISSRLAEAVADALGMEGYDRIEMFVRLTERRYGKQVAPKDGLSREVEAGADLLAIPPLGDLVEGLIHRANARQRRRSGNTWCAMRQGTPVVTRTVRKFCNAVRATPRERCLLILAHIRCTFPDLNHHVEGIHGPWRHQRLHALLATARPRGVPTIECREVVHPDMG